MKVVNTHEAKTHLSRLLDEASAGEEIVIARAGQPVARLVRYEAVKNPRKLGVLKGKIVESADCWESEVDVLASIDSPLHGGEIFSSKVAEEPRS